MRDTVQGGVLPVLEVALDPGESVMAEAGEFSWMSANVQMSTGMGGGGGGGGLKGAFKRIAGGGALLMTTYTSQSGPGMVAFAAKLPGSILPVDVGPGLEHLVHRHGFIAGTPGVELTVALQQSFRGGIFGGEGFILQKLAGSGRAWVQLGGSVNTYTLAPGQTLLAHPGHVGMFEASVTFQVQRTPGMANRYLGEDGHHMVVLTGPGTVWLQTMPLPILAGAIAPYLPQGSTGSAAATGGIAGALGGLLGGGS